MQSTRSIIGLLLHNRYRVTEELGRGGMGAVYRAVDEQTKRSVAVKQTLVETAELKRAFRREADLLANLNHRALPKIVDRFDVGDEQYIVMDYVSGSDLKTLLEHKHKKPALVDVLRWADELLDVLDYLHGHNPPVVHRDIKPANLKLTDDGRIVLLDFGLAKGMIGEMTRAGNTLSVFGYTLDYAALEQIQGERTNPRSDLYSLGATLYHLLTDRKPADALKRATELLSGETDPLMPIKHIAPDIPEYVATTVWQAMSLKPSDRPTTAAEMRKQLCKSDFTWAMTTPKSLEELTHVGSQPVPEGIYEKVRRQNRKELARIKSRAGSEPPTASSSLDFGIFERVARSESRQGFLHDLAHRFTTWRDRRNEAAQERAARRRLTHEEAATAPNLEPQRSGAERLAEFMRDTKPGARSAEPSTSNGAQPASGATAALRRAANAAPTHTNAPTDSDIDDAPEIAVRKRTPPAPVLDYELPNLEFLQPPAPRHEQAEQELRDTATRIAEKLKEFNVGGKIEYICPGPVVTTYEFKPDPGVNYSRITNLSDDLCLALRAEYVRIDRVPGKAHVGIEVPNQEREPIMLREVLASRVFTESASPLTLALGKTIDGLNYVADLARMPHLLIAGATGTGKSVCLNALVVSILYKARPDEVKLVLIDTKHVDFNLFSGIPHLATPIINEPAQAARAFKWINSEVRDRYKHLAKWGIGNIDGYNAEVRRRNLVKEFDEEGNPHKTLPYLVIFIDDLADLTRSIGTEEHILPLMERGRAVGIHLVLTTQRPSSEVITNEMKAAFTSRIAFRVASRSDSRTILDTNGAEQLLGRGDMLFLPPGTSQLVHVHGAYLDEVEVAKIVSHIKAQGITAVDEIYEAEKAEAGASGGVQDELYDQALRICVEMKCASTSVLQRRLRIGYGRAAAILDGMERDGLIGPADGSRPRPVLGRAYETVSHWDDLVTSGSDV